MLVLEAQQIVIILQLLVPHHLQQEYYLQLLAQAQKLMAITTPLLVHYLQRKETHHQLLVQIPALKETTPLQ